MIEETNEQLQQKAEDQEKLKLEGDVKNTEKLALNALDKEKSLEDMLEKEEEEREKEEEAELQRQIDAENKKTECLEKSIKAKVTEEQFNLNRVRAQEKIDKVKAEVKREIDIKRKSIKDKIDAMRRRATFKKKALQEQIINIRTAALTKAKSFTKQGEASQCGKTAPADVEGYCNNKFIVDLEKNKECLASGPNFCFICCNNEFGDYHLVDRNKCFKDYCEKASDAAKKECTPAEGDATLTPTPSTTR
jgi:hypothetical protein